MPTEERAARRCEGNEGTTAMAEDTDNPGEIGTSDPMIAQLWERAKDLHLRLVQARGSAEEAVVTATLLQLRAMALLACSIPAVTMSDLRPKVMFAALFREALDDGAGYTLALIELAVSMDMRRLQGPPVSELVNEPEPDPLSD
jgi:hypothetical protein